MSTSVDLFELWLSDQSPVAPAVLYSSGILTARVLSSFGVWLHDAGYPRYVFVHAILGLQSRLPWWRPHFGEAWRISQQWAAAEPSQLRPPLPRAAIKAAFSLCLLWQWPIMGTMILMAFTMFLRPSELFNASRLDLSLPCDRLESSGDAFLRIRRPKTWRSFPVQHARCSDPLVIDLMTAVWKDYSPTAPLAPFGAGAFRLRWNKIFSRLGIPSARAEHGATPGCLRGSGATDFYLITEDVPKTFWRGRWRRPATAERYLQAAAAVSLLATLPAEQRETVQLLAQTADGLARSFLACGLNRWPSTLEASRNTSLRKGV